MKKLKERRNLSLIVANGQNMSYTVESHVLGRPAPPVKEPCICCSVDIVEDFCDIFAAI